MTNQQVVDRWINGGDQCTSSALYYPGDEFLRPQNPWARNTVAGINFGNFFFVNTANIFRPYSPAAQEIGSGLQYSNKIHLSKILYTTQGLLERIVGKITSESIGNLKLVDTWYRSDSPTTLYTDDWYFPLTKTTYYLLEYNKQQYMASNYWENKTGNVYWLTKLADSNQKNYNSAERALFSLIPSQVYDSVRDLSFDDQTRFLIQEWEISGLGRFGYDEIVGFKRGVLRQGDLWFVPCLNKVEVSLKSPCNDADLFDKYCEMWPQRIKVVEGHPGIVSTGDRVMVANSMEYVSNRVHHRTNSDLGTGKSRHTFTDIGIVTGGDVQVVRNEVKPSKGDFLVRGIVRHPGHDQLRLVPVDNAHSQLGGWFQVFPAINEEWAVSEQIRRAGVGHD